MPATQRPSRTQLALFDVDPSPPPSPDRVVKLSVVGCPSLSWRAEIRAEVAPGWFTVVVVEGPLRGRTFSPVPSAPEDPPGAPAWSLRCTPPRSAPKPSAHALGEPPATWTPPSEDAPF